MVMGYLPEQPLAPLHELLSSLVSAPEQPLALLQEFLSSCASVPEQPLAPLHEFLSALAVVGDVVASEVPATAVIAVALNKPVSAVVRAALTILECDMRDP